MKSFQNAHSIILIFMVCFFIFWSSVSTQSMQGQYINMEIAYLIFLCLIAASYRIYKHFIFSSEDMFFCLYLILVTIGIFLCKDKHRAFTVYKAFAPILGLAYFIGKTIALKDLKIVRYIIFAIAMCVFIVSIAGFSEILFKKSAIFFIKNNPFFKIHPIGERMMSTLMHPSVLGSYFVITLPACFFMMEKGNKKIIKIAGLFILVLGVSALFFTFSRGAWLGAIIAFFICYWGRHKKFLLFLMICFAAFFYLSMIFSAPGYFIKATFSLEGIKEGLIAESRINYIQIMMQMIKGHELFGIGLDHYRIFFNAYSTERIADIYRIPDNMYFTILLETGILSFLSYIAFTAMVLRRGFTFMNKTKNSEQKNMMVVFIAGLTGFMIKMFTYDAFYWFAPIVFFGLYMGLCSGLSHEEATSQNKNLSS